jgi:hypothetical protein
MAGRGPARGIPFGAEFNEATPGFGFAAAAEGFDEVGVRFDFVISPDAFLFFILLRFIAISSIIDMGFLRPGAAPPILPPPPVFIVLVRAFFSFFPD